jgi:hypothetical protein
MSFSARVKKELYPLQKKYFTLIEKKIRISRCETEPSSEEDVRASIRGAFLLGGSISDPSKSYHFEIAVKSSDEAEELARQMRCYDVEGHVHRRRNSFVVYVKDASGIVTLLGAMGAFSSLMDFENARILNEMRGSVNRQVNCETANIKRTVSSSVKQIEAIKRIESRQGIESLPVPLQVMARIRMEYPDASLAQLGEYMHPPMGKSGVNHRLRKIMEIADSISQ